MIDSFGESAPIIGWWRKPQPRNDQCKALVVLPFFPANLRFNVAIPWHDTNWNVIRLDRVTLGPRISRTAGAIAWRNGTSTTDREPVEST